jgi:hypothetical protein
MIRTKTMPTDNETVLALDRLSLVSSSNRNGKDSDCSLGLGGCEGRCFHPSMHACRSLARSSPVQSSPVQLRYNIL